MHKRITMTAVIIALFVIFGGLSFAVEMYFDYLWFSELGKTVVFTTALYAKSILGSGILLISFLFVYLNLYFANRGPGLIQIGIPTPTGQITAYTVEAETVRRMAGLLAAAVGIILGLSAATSWEQVWSWLNRVNFGASDPIFSRDVSFYVFTMPLLRGALRLLLALSFISLIGVIVLYYFKGILKLSSLRDGGRSRSSVHVSLLAALIFILLSVKAYLDRYEVLYGNHDVFSGANYADLHARVPMLTLLAIAAAISALLWIYNAFSSKNRAAILAVLLYFVVLFGGGIYPAVIQKFIVAPNELDRESPQITHNIEATLQAYGLQDVAERNLTGDKALTPQDIENNATTIHSIRLWDHEPLLDALKQIQEIRTYYDFISVDNDRYMVNGELQQFMISPR